MTWAFIRQASGNFAFKTIGRLCLSLYIHQVNGALVFHAAGNWWSDRMHAWPCIALQLGPSGRSTSPVALSLKGEAIICLAIDRPIHQLPGMWMAKTPNACCTHVQVIIWLFYTRPNHQLCNGWKATLPAVCCRKGQVCPFIRTHT